jgi:hypothetical protein
MSRKSRKDEPMSKEKAEAFADGLIGGIEEIAITVEAAGTWSRAKPLVAEDHPDPTELAELEQLVPTSRGGPNDSPEMAQMWDEVVRELMQRPDERKLFAAVQQELVLRE